MRCEKNENEKEELREQRKKRGLIYTSNISRMYTCVDDISPSGPSQHPYPLICMSGMEVHPCTSFSQAPGDSDRHAIFRVGIPLTSHRGPWQWACP